MGRGISITLGLLILLPISCFTYVHSLYMRGENHLAAMLTGGRGARLSRFEIGGQEWRVASSDPVLVRIFENAIRDNGPRPNRCGYSYEMTLAFEDGSLCRTWLDADPEFLLIWIGIPGDGGECRRLALTRETHPKIAEMFDFLLPPWPEVRNRTLELAS